MKSFTSQSLTTLVVITLLSACSRPYATFQKTTPERYYTKTPVGTPAADVSTALPETHAVAQSLETPPTEALTPIATTTVDTELQKVEALVSAKAGVSANKKLTRNLARARQLVTEMRANAASASAVEKNVTTTATQKLNLAQRLVMKSIDKKIQKKLSPEKTMAKSLTRIGLAVALIGLVLVILSAILLSGVLGGLGGLAILVGLVILIVGLLQ